MKYFSLVFVIVLMAWSWSVSQNPSTLSESTHVGIQNDLQRVITEYIEQNIPNVKDIRFDRFWTESLKKNKVKASFSYSFEENQDVENKSARIGIEGHAILNRVQNEADDYEVWSLDEIYVLNNRIDFKEGVNIQTDHPDAK